MKTVLVKYFILAVTGISALALLNATEQSYGYWKTDNQTDTEFLSKMTTSEISSCKTCKNEIVNGESGRNIYISLNAKNTENIPFNEDDAKNKAIGFLERKADILGIDSLLQIKKIEKGPNGYAITFEPQTFGSIKICDNDGGGINILNDGSIGSLRLEIYPNLTAPTRPKISEIQIKQIMIEYATKDNPAWEAASQQEKDEYIKEVMEHPAEKCIFPKWHPDGEYWTYHLSWHLVDSNTWWDAMSSELLHAVEAAIVE